MESKRTTLRTIAADINADPKLGLKAKVESSYSSTDSDIPGTRLISKGRGREGLHITVRLVRNDKLVCDVDTSETYRTAREVRKWLAEWRIFNRTYHGAPSPNFHQYHVEGESKASRGRVMTLGQLKALAETELVWVRVKDHSETYARIDGVESFHRDGPTFVFSGGAVLDLRRLNAPKNDADKLFWDNSESRFGIYRIRLTPYVYVKRNP
jgi:hypothetical protein